MNASRSLFIANYKLDIVALLEGAVLGSAPKRNLLPMSVTKATTACKREEIEIRFSAPT